MVTTESLKKRVTVLEQGTPDEHFIDLKKLGLTPQQVIEQRKESMPTERKAIITEEKRRRAAELEVVSEGFLERRAAELEQLDADEEADNAKF